MTYTQALHTPVVGVPSASASRLHGDEPLARYNLFTFFRGPEGLRIRHSVRGIEQPAGGVVKLREDVLEYAI